MNCGALDRTVRVIASVGLFAAAWYLGGNWGLALAGCGGAALMPAVTGVCPLWSVMGVSTAQTNR